MKICVAIHMTAIRIPVNTAMKMAASVQVQVPGMGGGAGGWGVRAGCSGWAAECSRVRARRVVVPCPGHSLEIH